MIAAALQNGAAISEAEAVALVPKVRSAFVDPCRWRVFDDTVQCLQVLIAAGWQHVVLSNHVPDSDAIFNSATLGYEKPHRCSFEAVLTADPGARFVMIGDKHTADVRGAEAAGMPAIFVRWPRVDALDFHASLATLPAVLA